jgi:hypothetical protein
MVRAKPSTAGFRQTNSLVLRLVAGLYALAFASLAVQIAALSGPRGIFPASEWLGYLAGQTPGPARFFVHPTLFWLGSGESWLTAACWLGAAFALAAAAGFRPVYGFIACFLLYLSFYTVCGPFLHFQWDLLLLETGFIAILAAPVRGYTDAPEPPRTIPCLFRFLLFKLMLASGLCKIASGDPTWRTLTALHFHFETQPLPPWTAWYFHRAPDGLQRLWVLWVFAVELVLPFLIFGGRRARNLAFWGIVFLQIAIVVTGNYGFFNWLTIVLSISLWDDGVLGWKTVRAETFSRARRIAAAAFCVFIVPVSVYLTASRWIERAPRSAFVDRWIVTPLQSWPLAGTYGLFSVMTTERREIVIEGSDDGEAWKAYEFRWKPGDPRRRPAFMAPYMPRADWQMWFAALGTWRQNPWLIQLCRRLLEGSPSVGKLFANDPFGGKPPKYLRLLFYEYRFAGPEARRQGLWWERTLIGAYAPAMTLKPSPSGGPVIE